MTDPRDNVSENERALEALLAAAFRLDIPEEISDEEAKLFFEQPVRLSKEDETAIRSWGSDFVDELLQREAPIPDGYRQDDIQVNQELEQEYFAMNRDMDGNGLDEETQRKIDEERRKALEEEDQNNDKSNGS